ncbi:MAG: ComEC/Rec2 family competence protein [Acidimicrobiia bacterium]|nr:ComEC/Rec2 family competence protein [Acidimicrobiia bacterium]
MSPDEGPTGTRSPAPSPRTRPARGAEGPLVELRRAAGPLGVLGAVVAGTRLGEWLGPSSGLLLLASGLVLTLAGVARRAGAVAATALLLGGALLATAATQRALDGLTRSPLAVAIDRRDDVVVRGSLVEDPRSGARRFGGTRVLVRLRSWARPGDGTWQPAGGRTVLVTTSGDPGARLRLLEAGDRVELAGWLAPLAGRDRHLRWRHAVARLDVVDLTGVAGPDTPLSRAANGLRHLVLRGGEVLGPSEQALVAGFLLGDTRDVPEEVVDDFRASGLTHLLAVSGSNVAFVLALAGPVLGRLGLRGRVGGGLAVLVLFGAMTRWEPSVLRAVAMAAGSMVALHLGRPTAGLRVLALAATALLLVDPFLAHSVGFALSCAATAGILLLAGPLRRRLPGPGWLREGLAVTAAAQVGVAPVAIPAFGAMPIATLPANLAAAPLAAPLTACGLVSGLFGGVLGGRWPGLAAALATPTAMLARAVEVVAALGARVPGSVDGRGALGLVAAGCLAAAVRRAGSAGAIGAGGAGRARR